jgi:hypothetical protein
MSRSKNLWLLSACGGLVGQNNTHFATERQIYHPCIGTSRLHLYAHRFPAEKEISSEETLARLYGKRGGFCVPVQQSSIEAMGFGGHRARRPPAVRPAILPRRGAE